MLTKNRRQSKNVEDVRDPKKKAVFEKKVQMGQSQEEYAFDPEGKRLRQSSINRFQNKVLANPKLSEARARVAKRRFDQLAAPVKSSSSVQKFRKPLKKGK